MSDKPNISIVTILNDIPDLYKLIEYHWETIDYPKEKLEWIIIDNSRENNSDKIPTLSENIIYIHVNTDEFIDKINFDRDDEKILWNYYKRLGYLPIGFLRDYAVGCTQYDYILHYDIDTIYNPKTLLRKLRTLKNNKLECIYCKCMLGYDIYEKGLYKLENEHSGYASTLFHTRDFWKRSGFKWTDIDNEAYNFHYNKGLDRNMDNSDIKGNKPNDLILNRWSPVIFSDKETFFSLLSFIFDNVSIKLSNCTLLPFPHEKEGI